MKLQDIKNLLCVDTVSRKDGVITVRKGFYYKMGKSSQDMVNKVKERLPNAEILDSGEHGAAFRGGASVAQGSHWYVKFRVGV